MRNRSMTRILLLALLLSSSISHACETITFSGNYSHVPASDGWNHVGLWDFAPMHPTHRRMGWWIPEGKYLGITTITFASKYIIAGGYHRNSYMVLHQLLTVTEHQPSLTFIKPLIVPGGSLLSGWMWNNSTEAQNMNFIIDGYLSSDSLFRDCK